MKFLIILLFLYSVWGKEFAVAAVTVENKTDVVKRQSVDKLSTDCTQSNGSEGECVAISSCPKMQELLNQGTPIEPCESDSGLITVCCKKKTVETEIFKSITRPPTYGLIAKQKCEEIKKLYEPKRFRFVIGGVNAQTDDYKHMAILGYRSSDSIQWYCGGSLISKKFILTAAHCLRSRDFGLVNWVRLGTTKIGKVDPDEGGQDFLVVNRIHHPGYKPPKPYNDIGLIELDREVTYSNFVAPACVFVEDRPPPGSYFATGWGLIEVHGDQSDLLQEVTLDLFGTSECQKAYEINKPRLTEGIIDSQFCAGSKAERKATCSSDTGGPLQFANLNGTGTYQGYTVFGVASFGKLCGLASAPGVYTKVSHYIPWIEEHVWPQTNSANKTN